MQDTGEVAFLLNYFWLCQLSWMIVEAVILYNALVKVFGTYTRNALLKYSVFGWGIPIIFPLIGVAWSSGTGVPFADPKTCFIKYPYGLVSFYGPVVLGVASNWIMFIFIARVILIATKTKAQQTGDSNTKLRIFLK
ncbi:adhesion G-protein coupled receptor D1-like [Bolinopsis microptera]|uniref:adhesion G-protein coupled receptor D1-like n=1 Tax=Bolinopsis microptera TaxID=2820187 RepID=UPI00307A06E9